MFDVIEMPLYWPVDVNYHEAKAFCTWKGPEYRLPTEAEHHRMRGEEVSIDFLKWLIHKQNMTQGDARV